MAAVAVWLLAGCDEPRFDNRFDPAGSSPSPVSIVVKRMPSDPRFDRAFVVRGMHLSPSTGTHAEGELLFEAAGGQDLRFEFWKGPGIDGDTRPSLRVPVQDGATYEAWFSPRWMEVGSQTSVENGLILRVGETWSGNLSNTLHAISKGNVPLRPWRVLRSSAEASIQPVDSSAGSLLSMIDTSITDPASKLMRFRLRPNGGRVCLGQPLGADGMGLDLRGMKLLSTNVYTGVGSLEISWTLLIPEGYATAARSFSMRDEFNSIIVPPDTFQIVTSNGVRIERPWKDAAQHVVALDFCASGDVDFDGALTNIDFVGVLPRQILPSIGGAP